MSKAKVDAVHRDSIMQAITVFGATRAAAICDQAFPNTVGQSATERANYLRAVDRGLQSAKKAGLVAYDSKRGWRLTAAGKKAWQSCA